MVRPIEMTGEQASEGQFGSRAIEINFCPKGHRRW